MRKFLLIPLALFSIVFMGSGCTRQGIRFCVADGQVTAKEAIELVKGEVLIAETKGAVCDSIISWSDGSCYYTYCR